MSVPQVPGADEDAAFSGFRRYPVVFIVLAVNLLAYAVLCISEGDFTISSDTAYMFGALVPQELIEGEYWRLLSYGFLHASLMHVIANTVCLIAWGVPLEGWLGERRMAMLYLACILLAGVGSFLLQTGPTVTVGASGGVSGLLGALFLLYLRGIVSLPASFFLINIGLNIAVPFMVPGIDWQAHLSGFCGGMLVMMILLHLKVPAEP